ncbi:MAG: PadR family transcriptional regulator [Anaerolineaceae bacterium]
MEIALTNPELIILGLVAEEPKYGYQIEQNIVQRGVREWTEIGFSSIYYILNKLEDRGLLVSEKHTAGERPARKIYRLTNLGRQEYQKAVRARLTSPRPRTDDFDIGLANLLALDRSELLQALTSYQFALNEKLIQVQTKFDLDGGDDLNLAAYELFNHSMAQLKAEVDWITEIIERLSK